MTLQLLRSSHGTVQLWTCLGIPGKILWKIWLKYFYSSLAFCLHVKNRSDPVTPTEDICDKRTLQSNWLKAFPAITQEQEFPQIWDLYSKIDNNVNFYLRKFPAKINDIIVQNKGKTLFWVKNPILTNFHCFCPKGTFPKKSDLVKLHWSPSI